MPHFSSNDISSFCENGYIVLENMLTPSQIEAAQDAQGGGQDEEQEAARRRWLTQRDLASVDSFSGTFSSRRTSEILGRYHGRARPSSVV